MKKICSIILTCSLVLSMAAPAFASNTDPVSEAIQQAETLSQKVNTVISAGGTYQDLLDMYVAEGILSYDDMLVLAEHDAALLAKQGASLNDSVISSFKAAKSDNINYQTVNISYDTMFNGAMTIADIALNMAGASVLPSTLLTGAATFAYNLWKDNHAFSGITIKYHVVRYYDDNSLSWRNQPFVDDYWEY